MATITCHQGRGRRTTSQESAKTTDTPTVARCQDTHPSEAS
ncbi:hypothetical protein ACQEVM_18605 [Streptomyces sp. CA-243310]